MNRAHDSVDAMTRAAASAEDPDTIAPFTAAAAWQALRHACAAVGLDSDDAELIRIGTNAVFRLTSRIVVRIAASTTGLEQARKQVVVARWLAGQEFPAVRVREGINQPLVIDDRVVTFWVSFAEDEKFAPIEDVARLIRQLHDLPQPAGFRLPTANAFERAEGRLGQLSALSTADSEYLHQRYADVRRRYERLEFVLPEGVIHGDASVGNVMMDRFDRPLMIDLDGFCYGHREWDLVITAAYYDRFGWHTADEYRRFVEIYGYDIIQWDGYPVLADVQELMMTIWMASRAATDVNSAAEASKRIQTMRDGTSRHTWEPA